MIPEWVYFIVFGASVFIALFPLYEAIFDKKESQSSEGSP